MSSLPAEHSTSAGTWLQARPRPALTLRNLVGIWRYCLLRLRFPRLRLGLFFADRGFELRVHPNARVRFGRGIRFMSNCAVDVGGVLEIGDGVFFNRGCHIVGLDYLHIGTNCLFGEMVSIHDENHVPGRGPESIASRGFATAQIVIGNNVWVGAKATILPGVRIGDNAVIGANAVVTRDVPRNTIVVGIPARVLREL